MDSLKILYKPYVKHHWMLKNIFNELMQAFSQTIFFKRWNKFQNLHKTCPLTEQVSIAWHNVESSSKSLSVRLWRHSSKQNKTLIDRRQSIYLTHTSIHPYDIHSNATLWCSASKHFLITEDSVFEDGLSWLVQSGYTNALWARQLQTTCLYMADQFKESNTIESKNVVVCKIVNRWQF